MPSVEFSLPLKKIMMKERLSATANSMSNKLQEIWNKANNSVKMKKKIRAGNV